ncbi:MAG TPA: PIN domain-containing protein [Planctomycetota bacterium]|nr:PIN domain-containing protein [Planctomycetota bacterium]
MPGVAVDSSVWVAAADPADRFCAASRAFFTAVVRHRSSIHIPAFAHVEVACAIARRTRDGSGARRLAQAMLAVGPVEEVATDRALLARALLAGTTAFLRGADALFVAATQATGATLVSWNDELVQRGGAVTPSDWMAANP